MGTHLFSAFDTASDAFEQFCIRLAFVLKFQQIENVLGDLQIGFAVSAAELTYQSLLPGAQVNFTSVDRLNRIGIKSEDRFERYAHVVQFAFAGVSNAVHKFGGLE